ncbi:hypothetical protein BZG36_01492 [Bifiguratus adelaidae]|uniref:Protein kinase domain-containing protein n=1 Tax=Bifiguratus adelaidae TaxID=1938954 RepID=A0A261Y4T7_9FUNG|nr:hypothetical protein BZG36_01492 [Bifiguratus adelaidae]
MVARAAERIRVDNGSNKADSRSTSSSSVSTPVKNAASHPHSSQSSVSESILQRLDFELADAKFVTDGLEEHLTGSRITVLQAAELLRSLYEAKLLTPLRKGQPEHIDIAIQEACEAALRQPLSKLQCYWLWPTFPHHRSETHMVTFVRQIATSVCKNVETNFFAKPFTSDKNYRLTDEFERPQLRPDFVLLPKMAWANSELRGTETGSYLEPEEALNNYKMAMCVGECKQSKLRDARRQVRKYIRGLKRTQPWRRYALALYWASKDFGVIRADQSGLDEDFFNITTPRGALDFVRTIFWLCTASASELGCDHTFHLGGGKKFPTSANGQEIQYIRREIDEIWCADQEGSVHYKVESVLHNSSSIRGRGTRVFAVREILNYRGELDGRPLVLKVSWQDRARQHDEAHFNRLASQRGVEHVLLALRSFNCLHDGKDDSTLTAIRGYDSSLLNQLPIEDRVQKRMVFPRARPLAQFESLEELVRGIVGAILGHKELIEKANIFHRDVSEFNVLLPERGSEQLGYLIDLDMAIDISERPIPQETEVNLAALFDEISPDSRKRKRHSDSETNGDTVKARRTGTVPYMAPSVMLGEEHKIHHDLQSFFFVLYLLPFSYSEPGPSGEPIQWPEFIQWWCQGSMLRSGSVKAVFFSKPASVLSTLVKDSASGWRKSTFWFRRYVGMVMRFYSVLWHDEKERKDVTHADVIQVLQTWLDATPDEQGQYP